jgi:predicted dehydrogenase
MKILIAGFGSIGRRHFRNLLALGESDILFYRTGHSILPSDELEGYVVETDLSEALAHHPDAMIVANPTALHLDVAIPAAEAGCHVFLEKPISHNLDRIDHLQEAVQRGGGQVFVGYQFRFHPVLRQVKRWLDEGAIGRPLSVHAHWGEYLPGWHPWEDYRQGYSARLDLGGGVILTLSHPLDYVRWLVGEVEALWAFTGRLGDLQLDVEDCAEIGLRFASGALGGLHLDYLQRPPAQRLEIIGVQGTIQWEGAYSSASLFRLDCEEWEVFPTPQGFERNTLFLEQMRHFLDVARGYAQPLCTLQDGIEVLRLALAAHASQAQGQLIHF